MEDPTRLWLNHIIASSIIRAIERDLRQYLLGSELSKLSFLKKKSERTQETVIEIRRNGIVDNSEISKLGFRDLGKIFDQNSELLLLHSEEKQRIVDFIEEFGPMRNTMAHSNDISIDALSYLQAQAIEIYNFFNKGSSRMQFRLLGQLIVKRFVPSPDDLRAFAASENALQYEKAARVRRTASFAQADLVERTLINYYTIYAGNAPQDAQYAVYRFQDGASKSLAFVTRQCWDSALRLSCRVQSNYIDPDDKALPNSQEITHVPHRIQMGRYDLMDMGPYTLRSIECEATELGLTFSEMDFFEWCDRFADLEDEFVLQLPRILRNQGKTIRPDLPLRATFLPDLNAVLQPEARLAAGGVVVLTVVPIGTEAQDALVLVEERSSEVADGRGLLTTIPRGFHDRFVSSREDFRLETTVMREVAEEVFNRSGLRKGELDTQAYFDACPPVAELLEHNTFRLQPTGFGFELLKGNYTVTYLLLVTDGEWWPRHRQSQALNYEFRQNGESMRVLLSDLSQIRKMLHRPDWTTEGYFAFIEGLRLLPEALKQHPKFSALYKKARAVEQILPTLAWTPFDTEGSQT